MARKKVDVPDIPKAPPVPVIGNLTLAITANATNSAVATVSLYFERVGE